MNRTAIKATVLVGLVCPTLLWISGCGATGDSSGGRSPDLETVRAAYVPAGYYLPFVVAKEQGLFEKRGYKIELQRYQDNAHMINLFLNGHLDVTAQSSFTMFPTELDHPGLLRFVYGQYANSYYFMVPSQSQFTSLADLNGATIGTWKSPTAVNYIKLLLGRAGLAENKHYTIQRFGATEWPAALENGVVDVVFGFDVLLARLALTNNYRYLAPDALEGLLSGTMVFNGGAFVSAKLTERNPDKARAIQEALLEAIEIIRTDRELTARIAADTLLPDGLSREQRLAIARAARFDVFTTADTDLIESARRTLDLLFEHGVVSERFDVSDLFWAPQEQEAKRAG